MFISFFQILGPFWKWFLSRRKPGMIWRKCCWRRSPSFGWGELRGGGCFCVLPALHSAQVAAGGAEEGGAQLSLFHAGTAIPPPPLCWNVRKASRYTSLRLKASLPIFSLPKTIDRIYSAYGPAMLRQVGSKRPIFQMLKGPVAEQLRVPVWLLLITVTFIYLYKLVQAPWEDMARKAG